MSHICRVEKTSLIDHMIGKVAGEHSENFEEKYRRQYYAGLDSVITCIKEWFEQKDYKMYATLEQL